MKKEKINYIITTSFKTNLKSPTEEQLKIIFNQKYYKYIMKTTKK